MTLTQLFLDELDRESHRTRNPETRARIAALTDEDARRKNPFDIRREAQRLRLDLPLFPTTTIGSYPQTETRELILRASGPDQAHVDAVLQAIRDRVTQYSPLS